MDQNNDRKTILLAEDDMFIRMDACEFLTDAGYHVVEARNASEAEGHLRNSPVDVLFTDIEMPGAPLNGLDLAALVDREWPNVSVLVTSGKVLPPDNNRSFGFLAKPYMARDVIGWIKMVLKED